MLCFRTSLLPIYFEFVINYKNQTSHSLPKVLTMQPTRILSMALLAISTLTHLYAHAQVVTVTMRASKPGVRVNPKMYGVFLEEINHGVDGGLYAEMIANRAFEDSRPPEGFHDVSGRWVTAEGYDSGFSVKEGTVPRWELRTGTGQAEWLVRTTNGLNSNSPYHLRVDVRRPAPTGKPVAVRNSGFWGLGFRSGAAYRVVAHVRSVNGKEQKIAILGEQSNGVPLTSRISGVTKGSAWTRIEGILTAQQTFNKGYLTIELSTQGRVDIDFVSCFPLKTWKNRPNGLRPDLAKMIEDLKPGFVRFPGGCVVEGGSIESSYHWKDGLGAVENRTERWNAWNYRRTHGVGAFEYLQLCEDLNAQPMWVGFAGQTCVYRNAQHVPLNNMNWVIQDNLDFLQYTVGSPSTPWGQKRALAGRTSPFRDPLIEIGNENMGPEYESRYRLLYDQVNALFPNLTTIADYKIAKTDFDFVDEHYYNAPSWFFNEFKHYDTYDRAQKPIYVGEVAVTSDEGGPDKGNMIAALSEGVFLMGCENNADVVKMVSYAPLLAHVEGRSGWHGMILFDSLHVAGTVSYHLWKLFHTNRPDITLPTSFSSGQQAPEVLSGKVGVGTWLTSAEYKDISVTQGNSVLFDSNSNPFNNTVQEGGQWESKRRVLRQTDIGTGFFTLGETSWTDYTLRMKARKIQGAEGFLILFGDKTGQRYWWNLGGWGNQEHGIERNRALVGKRVAGSIETNRWYDIEVSVAGGRIVCKLDGKIIHDLATETRSDVFATSGYDQKRGEVIIKLVNATPTAKAFSLSMEGIKSPASTALVTKLHADNPQANNTLMYPNTVVPSSQTIQWPPQNGLVTVEPYGLAIIRFKGTGVH